jgi:hypothetical protein
MDPNDHTMEFGKWGIGDDTVDPGELAIELKLDTRPKLGMLLDERGLYLERPSFELKVRILERCTMSAKSGKCAEEGQHARRLPMSHSRHACSGLSEALVICVGTFLKIHSFWQV